ncbi:hypothetical protein BJX99DRAFT_172666 [Aspergillus californicus]
MRIRMVTSETFIMNGVTLFFSYQFAGCFFFFSPCVHYLNDIVFSRWMYYQCTLFLFIYGCDSGLLDCLIREWNWMTISETGLNGM